MEQVSDSNSKGIAIIRLGQIGDIITAAESARVIDAKLFVAQNKISAMRFRPAPSYMELVSAISGKLHAEILPLDFRARDILSSGQIKQVLLMVQTPSFWLRTYSKVLSIQLGKQVELIYEGSQWFMPWVYNHNREIKNKIQRKKLAWGERDKVLRVVIFWNGKEPEKNLNFNSLSHISKTLRHSFGKCDIVLLGAPLDLNLPAVTNLTGKTSLAEAFAEIDMSDFVISVDTGPLHYAALKDKLGIGFIARRYPLVLWVPLLGNIGYSITLPSQPVNSPEALNIFDSFFYD